MNCNKCIYLRFGVNTTYSGTWEMCVIAEKKGIHIGDFKKKIFGKKCKYFEKINYKEIREEEKKRKLEFLNRIKIEKEKMI